MIVVGLDISTEKISYSALENESLIEWGETFSPLRGPKGGIKKSVNHMIQSFEKDIIRIKPDVIYIEGLQWIQNRSSFLSLGKVLGALEYLCFINGVECNVVEGRVWKSGMSLSKNANKEDIRNWVLLDSRAGIETGNSIDPFTTQDQFDAYAISRYGWICENNKADRKVT